MSENLKLSLALAFGKCCSDMDNHYLQILTPSGFVSGTLALPEKIIDINDASSVIASVLNSNTYSEEFITLKDVKICAAQAIYKMELLVLFTDQIIGITVSKR